ncbi:fumarylacetoacetate hydrolase family protein (plasmid) [Halarchaeum sp. CBA1220]|uniref:fumarylacetoacetate hydrolase family protein n=1 Tax=Halarchaeum sp. CBA1220 TaxID=1853682 RepID=UPI000F3A83A2|nr:fumarylacetoacetate hydrolase family protein [Halarchaeum sp. CBA1220]QLC34773.1 fumarylacetoacetate hydrolase family protein [Halarchaeum sp. CBA1220]
MRYYHLSVEGSDGTHLVAETNDGEAYDLTSASEDLGSFTALARAANATEQTLDDVAAARIPDADSVDPGRLAAEADQPVRAEEVWASGVTYEISEQAREEESGKPEVYLDVYESERPELFLKATPSRTVGPNEPIGVRGDSTWDVPEPELAVVIHRGDVVGYTVGNDVSSRSIEGENPLYLPQAKVFERCCSIGPCVASPGTVGDPHELTLSMRIARDGDVVYEDETTTGEMVHSCDELVDYLGRHNVLPETAVLLTGTGLVPDDFTLQDGDEITIDVENVGELTNGTVTV